MVITSATRAAAQALSEASLLLDSRSLRAALHAIDRAQALGADPDECSSGRWLAYMLLGNFGAAWEESDAIRGRGAPDPHRFWNGEDLAGKRVIVRCLHGFGDAIQFLRFAPALRAIASDLVIEVPPRLLPLASSIDGVGAAITWGAEAPAAPPDWDVQVEVNELPYLFRTTLATLPNRTPYLSLPSSSVRAAAREMRSSARRMRVGMVWSSGEWDRSRSIPFSSFESLFTADSGIEFWSLQGGSASSDAKALFDTGKMRDSAICGDGILPLASVIANLDLVITVDTLAAHLAGALAKPAWVLLQHVADWRWMLSTDRSPWYSSLRLFRQPVQGDWNGLLEIVSAELAALSRATDTLIA